MGIRFNQVYTTYWWS